jgi:hypothetical protein
MSHGYSGLLPLVVRRRWLRRTHRSHVPRHWRHLLGSCATFVLCSSMCEVGCVHAWWLGSPFIRCMMVAWITCQCSHGFFERFVLYSSMLPVCHCLRSVSPNASLHNAFAVATRCCGCGSQVAAQRSKPLTCGSLPPQCTPQLASADLMLLLQMQADLGDRVLGGGHTWGRPHTNSRT